MREESLREYSQTIIPARELTVADSQFLWRLKQDGHIDLAINSNGDTEIETTSHVGVIQLARVRLEILPKIEGPHWPVVLIHMLSRVYGVEDLQRLTVTPSSTQAEVLEHFSRYFLDVIDKLVSEGLILGYVRVQSCSKSLRGRVLLNRLWQPRFLFGGGIPCEYEILCEDRKENRIIKVALSRVGQLRLDRQLQTRLRYFTGLFAPVPDDGSINGDSVDDVIFTRLNEHYRHPLALSKLVLESLFIAFRSGEVPFYSFLVDMNELFERYVVAILADKLGMFYRVSPHPRFRIAGDSNNVVHTITVEPDFIVRRVGSAQLVGDAKYKGALIQSPFSTEGLRNQDFYQALAYAAVTNLPSILVYPTHSVGCHLADIFRVSGQTIGVTTLDLSLPVDEIGRDALEFADRLLAGTCPTAVS